MATDRRRDTLIIPDTSYSYDVKSVDVTYTEDSSVTFISPESPNGTRVLTAKLQEVIDNSDTVVIPYIPIANVSYESLQSTRPELQSKLAPLITARKHYQLASTDLQTAVAITEDIPGLELRTSTQIDIQTFFHGQITKIEGQITQLLDTHFSDPKLQSTRKIVESLVSTAEEDAKSVDGATTILNARELATSPSTLGISELQICEQLAVVREHIPQEPADLLAKAVIVDLTISLASAIGYQGKDVCALLPFDPKKEDLSQLAEDQPDFFPNLVAFLDITGQGASSRTNHRIGFRRR